MTPPPSLLPGRRARSWAAVAVVVAAGLLVGCESFFIPDAEPVEPGLVVDGAFSADSAWAVRVTRLRVLGQSRPGPAPDGFTVADAAVEVRPEGGGSPVPLSHVGGGRYEGPEGLGPVPGGSYRLVVTHPSLGRAEAVGRAPAPPVFEVGPAEEVDPGDEGPRKEYRFRLRLRGDGAGLAVALSQVQPPYEGETDRRPRLRPVPFSSDDPDLRAYFFDVGPVRTYASFYEGAVLRSDVRAGEWRDITVTALTSRHQEAGDEVVVRVVALDPDLRDHLYTRSLQEQYEGDPFADPAPLASNVEGGRGVFGGYTQRAVVVSLAATEP